MAEWSICQSSPINSLAWRPLRNPVMLICIVLGSGCFSASSWLKTNSTTTSSSMPIISVILLVTQGRRMFRSIFDVSTFKLRCSENFICLSSFLCLSEKRLSCSALVPRKNPASVILVKIVFNPVDGDNGLG